MALPSTPVFAQSLAAILPARQRFIGSLKLRMTDKLKIAAMGTWARLVYRPALDAPWTSLAPSPSPLGRGFFYAASLAPFAK
jgi:hypothetical protein